MHTPGPWSVASDSNGNHEVVRNNAVLRETRPVASIYRVDEQGFNDARLIAASPDLYAALQKIASNTEKEECTANMARALGEIARAALAKVGG